MTLYLLAENPSGDYGPAMLMMLGLAVGAIAIFVAIIFAIAKFFEKKRAEPPRPDPKRKL